MAIHRLSEKDLEARTAICSLCGPVKLKKCGPYWRCYEGYRPVNRRSKIYSKYGVNRKQWDAMLIAQSGRCLICESPMLDPHVDHCHETGVVRGLLCRSCNTGLGAFRDDVARLGAAIDYLVSRGVR